MKKILLFLLTIFVLASCGESEETKRKLSQEERERLHREDSLALKVAVLPTMDCLPLFVAKEEGLFDSLKVDVRLRMWNAQMDCDEALKKGSVEGVVTDLVRGERMISEGMALRYVATTNAYWQVISNRLARIRKLSQLGDKMIAMTRYSATDLMAGLAVDSGKPKDMVFRIQVNNVYVRLQMLLNNEMDALVFTEPQATAARMHKNPVLMDSRDKKLELGVIAFKERALRDKNRQKQLTVFVKAYDQACDSINKHGVQYYAECIKKYCKVDDQVVEALPQLHYPHALPPRKRDIDAAKKFLQ